MMRNFSCCSGMMTTRERKKSPDRQRSGEPDSTFSAESKVRRKKSRGDKPRLSFCLFPFSFMREAAPISTLMRRHFVGPNKTLCANILQFYALCAELLNKYALMRGLPYAPDFSGVPLSSSGRLLAAFKIAESSISSSGETGVKAICCVSVNCSVAPNLFLLNHMGHEGLRIDQALLVVMSSIKLQAGSITSAKLALV